MLLPDSIPKRPDSDAAPSSPKHVSFDLLVRTVHQRPQQLPDTRSRDENYSITDSLMSAVAMFSLKDSSLLAFQEQRNDHNMKALYRIENFPSDTRMRELLDPVSASALRPLFNDVFQQLQRSGALKRHLFDENSYLLSMDGIHHRGESLLSDFFACENVA